MQPQQELKSLRAARAELLKEKEELSSSLEDWRSKISTKKEIISQLEQTVSELQKPEGRRTGLLRCAAEFGRSPPEPAPAASAARATGPSSEELSLSCRLAEAVATGPNAEVSFGWSREDFQKEFALEEGPMKEFLGKLSQEQRLVWEIQNPPENSLKVDRALLQELKAANRKNEMELLLTAVGPPTAREREYRVLLWLQHNDALDASYVEASAMNTSLLTLACKAGYGDTARELIRRSADVNQENKDRLTALQAACSYKNWDCASLLLESGADANKQVQGAPMLVWAAKEQSEGLIRSLLKASAEVECVDEKGRSAFMSAAERGRKAVCELLLEARADVERRDAEGKTAADLALERQQFAVLDWLNGLA